jgi:probable addiction module antidote protein
MLVRKDGTSITPDNLTDRDVALSPWNILEYLDTEEEIREYLEGVAQDIREGECEASFFAIALVKAAKARTINQLAKETGADRQALCDMFLDVKDDARVPRISHDAIAKVAKAFAVPVPVLV